MWTVKSNKINLINFTNSSSAFVSVELTKLATRDQIIIMPIIIIKFKIISVFLFNSLTFLKNKAKTFLLQYKFGF